jgi:hypothetical protein
MKGKIETNGSRPIQLSDYVWSFYGCFIHLMRDKILKPYRVYKDNESQDEVGFFGSFKEAKTACIENQKSFI